MLNFAIFFVFRPKRISCVPKHVCCGDWQNWGAPLVSLRYSAVDTFLDDWIAVYQRTYQGCAFAWWQFFSVVLFSSYWPLKCTKGTWRGLKNHFLEKSNPLMEKFQNFATIWKYSCGHWFVYSCKVSWKSVKRSGSDQTGVWYSSQRKVSVWSLSLGSWSDLAKNFIGSLFPHSPSLCQVFSKSVQLLRR